MSDRRSIITITGDLGSGKSTVSAILAESLNYRKFSTGDLQRNLAREKGMTSLELNKFTEDHPEIDREIDAGVVKLAENNSRIIIDSRLAWHFVPDSFKVYLTVDPMTASSRILSAYRGEEEQYSSLEEACDQLTQRRASEKLRFKLLYDIEIDDPRNYSVIVDTTFANPDEVAGKIIEAYNDWRSSTLTVKAWFNPKRLFPTKTIDDRENQAIIRRKYDADLPVIIVKSDDNYFIYDGHRRVSAAIASDSLFIPCVIMAVNDEFVAGGMTAGEFVRDNFSISKARAWEDTHGIAYTHVPEIRTRLKND